MNTKSFSMSSFTEEADDWLNSIREFFKKQLKSNVPADVCVFQVPKSLRTVKPDHYVPQMIGLGPYNHLNPELRDMERIKLDATCRLLRVFQFRDFDALTNKLAKLNPHVRACYHKNLDWLDEIQLAWIMAVDSAFLFYILCHHIMNPEMLKSSRYLKDIGRPVGRKLAEDAIMRDVMMLENQVPLFVMKEMLALLCSPRHDGGNNKDDEQKRFSEGIFPQILVSFCETLSPIKCTPNTKELASKALKRAHLLDLLHVMVVPREDEIYIDIPRIDSDADQIETQEEKDGKEKSLVPETIEEAAQCISEAFDESGLREMELKLLDTAMKSKGLPMENKIKPHAIMLKGVLQIQEEFTDLITKPFVPIHRKAEDFLLPRASRLAKAGVIFAEAKTIQDISFDQTKKTLYLPVMQINVNSEVIIRNLVAYEAMAMHKSLKFARYVELMNGLIETVDDVKLLRRRKILISHMKDEEVTSIFNNTSRSIQLSTDRDIDLTIQILNKFYKESSNIMVRNVGKLFAHGFWKTLALVAIIVYLMLMFLESFCTAYNCSSTSKRN